MAQMPRQRAITIQNRAQEFPVLELGDLAFRFVAAHLLVQSVEQLLAGSGSGKCGAMVERAAKPAEIEQAFRRAIESYSHPVQQIDNGRCRLTHGFYGRLIGKKVTAVNGVVKMLPGSVAFAFKVLGRVDAALSAYGVRPLHRHNGKQINMAASFGNFYGCRQACESATNHDNFRVRCHFSRLPNFDLPKSLFFVLVIFRSGPRTVPVAAVSLVCCATVAGRMLPSSPNRQGSE